jgi:hypothetical protein
MKPIDAAKNANAAGNVRDAHTQRQHGAKGRAGWPEPVAFEGRLAILGIGTTKNQRLKDRLTRGKSR